MFGNIERYAILLLVLCATTAVKAQAQSVTFTNPLGQDLELHVRNGPVDQHPDQRSSKNTTMKSGDTWDDDVGSGDVWFAYGNQRVNTTDNPELCNAKGGAKIRLDKSHRCFVNN